MTIFCGQTGWQPRRGEAGGGGGAHACHGSVQDEHQEVEFTCICASSFVQVQVRVRVLSLAFPRVRAFVSTNRASGREMS